MYFSHDGKFVRTDIWREGEYLDLWSVPHFLSGMMVALAAYFVGFDAVPSFIIAFLIFVGYEMFEALAKIEETRWNRILDVVVGMVSFAPTFLLAPMFSGSEIFAALVVVTLVDSVLSFLGWRASQKAAVLESKLRAEFEAEMRKLKEARDDFGRKLHLEGAKWKGRGRALRQRTVLRRGAKKAITKGVPEIS